MRKIVITAAGSSKRFKNQGINIPKYEIIANGHSLFYWSLISLKKFFNYAFIFIFQKDNFDNDFVVSELQKLNIQKYTTVLLESETEGQASTVMQAYNVIDPDDEILVFNIDTHINPEALNDTIFSDDGCIVTTNVPGDHWSFAKIQDNYVIQVSEKEKISDHASVGMYYFKNFKEFTETFNKYSKEIKDIYKETYICPIYQYYIYKNKKIGYYEIDSKDFVCLGTPEELTIFDPNWKRNIK